MRLAEHSKKFNARRSVKPTASQVKLDEINARIAKQEAWEQEIRNRKLSLPLIPTREEADREGCFIPKNLRLAPLGWTQDIIDAVGELPDNMDPREVEAFRLFPAFMAEYGHRYLSRFRTTPAAVLSEWRKALTPSDFQLQQGKFLMPPELRFVVEEFANPSEGAPQWFNIAIMRNAIKYKMTGDATVREAVAQAAKERQFNADGTLRFHQHVSPYLSLKSTAEADWVSLAGYPHAFPDDLLTRNEVTLINRLITYRFQNDESFTSTKGRWMAETMAQAVSYEVRRGRKVPPARIIDLAFRFSGPFIARTLGG